LRLTEIKAKALRPPEGKADYFVPDDDCAGLGIRFRDGGVGTYVLRFSIGNRDRRLSFGQVGKVTLAAARLWARSQQADIGNKIDPSIERAKAKIQNGIFMPDLVDGFIEEMQRHGRSADHVERTRQYLNGTERSAYFRPLHKIPVAQIDRATVGQCIEAIVKENGKIAATRARAALSAFFGWVIGEAKYGVEFNAVEHSKKYQSQKRDHFLEPEEIREVWKATDDNSDYSAIIRLLTLTAARRTQIGDLDRGELKLDQNAVPTLDRLISLPARVGRSKNKERFLIPLSEPARAILQARKPRADSTFIFGEGAGGFSGWSKGKAALDERLGNKIRPWRLHDLRRTFETLGQDVCKIQPHVADALINHVGAARSGIKAHYNFALLLDEKRDAMTRWGQFIEGLMA
jgi:integrase